MAHARRVVDPVFKLRQAYTMSRIPGLTTSDLVSPNWEIYAALLPIAGEPGLSQQTLPGGHTIFAIREGAGDPIGVLLVVADKTQQPRSLHVIVHPLWRRCGIASELYEAAAVAGLPIDTLSGRSGLTPDGVAFRVGRRMSNSHV